MACRRQAAGYIKRVSAYAGSGNPLFLRGSQGCIERLVPPVLEDRPSSCQRSDLGQHPRQSTFLLRIETFNHGSLPGNRSAFDKLNLNSSALLYGSALGREPVLWERVTGNVLPVARHFAATAAPEVAEKKVPKEPTPQDCDEAFEDLIEAKEKARRSQELIKEESWSSWLKGLLLSLGPSLRAIASMSLTDWARTVGGWGRAFWRELQHYWVGTKLLWADMRISSRLLLKLLGGRSLTRRERQQLTRTTADVFRLVPFAVFIIVPFMEFLLPFALRLFPNMLPSTFQSKTKEEEALKKRLQARLHYASFLQDTVAEMAKEVKATKTGETKKTAEGLAAFMSKARTGGKVSNSDILAFAQLFNDELTLDNISRSRLVSMCKYMGLQPFGTDAYLRYTLRTKLAWIKEDDKLIQAEGVESLSEDELRQACRERGMLGLLAPQEMRQQLRDWLELSLVHAVPSSLLILSRSFSVAGRLSAEEAVQATLSSLPNEVVDSVSMEALQAEDSLVERKRKLEYLKQQDQIIKEEALAEARELERLKRMAAEEQRDVALEEMQAATGAGAGAGAGAETQTQERKEELYKLSRALAVLASASSVSKERADFLALVNREIDLYKNMVEAAGTEGEAEARKAYQEARAESDRAAQQTSSRSVSGALIQRVDEMIKGLEKDLDEADAKIGDRWQLLDRDRDGKVTPEEVAAAAEYLRSHFGDSQEPAIRELIQQLAKDPDGNVLIEDIVKLGELSTSSLQESEKEKVQQSGQGKPPL